MTVTTERESKENDQNFMESPDIWEGDKSSSLSPRKAFCSWLIPGRFMHAVSIFEMLYGILLQHTLEAKDLIILICPKEKLKLIFVTNPIVVYERMIQNKEQNEEIHSFRFAKIFFLAHFA